MQHYIAIVTLMGTKSLGKIDESIFSQVVTILDFRERVLTHALKNTVEKTLRSQQ